VIPYGNAIESRKKPKHGERVAPAREGGFKGQKADQPDHAGLDGGAAEHGRGWNGRRRIGERHPAMHRHERDFQSKSGDRQRQRRVPPRRSRQRGHDVGDPQAAAWLACREQHEAHQQERLAEYREGHIDTARAPRLGAAIMRDQPEGWDADESVNR